MALRFLYLAPADMFTLHGNVSGSVLNPTYDVNWLVDGLPSRPVHSGSSGPTWTVTNTAKPVNLVAACNWNLDAGGVITIGGGVSTTLTMPNYAGRVPYNPVSILVDGNGALQDVPGVGSISTITGGNSVQVIAGELVAGKARELERPIFPGGERGYDPFNVMPDRQQIGNVAITRKDTTGRRFSGETVLTSAGLAAVQAWYDSTNDNELFSIIVPDPLLNDAWAVKFAQFSYRKQGPDEFRVILSLVEIPRRRW